MSNNENTKNDFTSINEIGGFSKEKISPLIDKIKNLKGLLSKASDVVSENKSKFQAKRAPVAEAVPSEKVAVKVEKTENVSDGNDEIKEFVIKSTTESASTPAGSAGTSENKGYQNTNYQQRNNQQGGYQQRQGGYQGQNNGYQPRPQGQGYQGQNNGYQPRPQGQGYQGQNNGYQPRPQGQGYQGQNNGYQPRPQGQGYQGQNNGYQPRPQGQGYQGQNNGYQPRPQGQGYQGQNNGYQPRPQGQGYQGQNNGYQPRPQGQGYQGQNNGYQPRPQGQGYQGNRPNNGVGGFAPKIDLPKVNNKTPGKKKTFDKDDSRRSLNKRDLFKKGYSAVGYDFGEAETVRHIKNKSRKKQEFIPVTQKMDTAIINTENLTVKTLSEKISISAVQIIKKLFELGITKTINEMIDFETAELVAVDLGITLELRAEKNAEDKLLDVLTDNSEVGTMVKRPPVVTIMGHVDHGKTSLLDYIRKESVASDEAGGITQHIGAYTVQLNGEQITFLDTPGHEAFTTMRLRGALVTDIAIIVVAADDGIMPQTIEAINHAKKADVSIMIAINKMDKPSANPDKILQQLTQHEVVPEQWGGNVIVCPVSAKTGSGITELLENVLLLAEVKELKANINCPAQGSIIEARLDKGTGPVATVLIQNGTLKVSDFVVAGTSIGKVRAMIDDKGRRVKEAGPAVAVSVLGFQDVPNAGDQLIVVKDEKLSKQVAEERKSRERHQLTQISSKRSLEDVLKSAQLGEFKTLNVVIKGDVQGSVEAIKQAVEKLSAEREEQAVKINIIHFGVGAVNESDIMLADTANAVVIAFNVRPDAKARVLADRSGIDVRNYRIIYDMIDDLNNALDGMLDPTFREQVIGHAEVRDVFKISSIGTIAGCYITDGKVTRNSKVRLLRDNIVVFEGTIASLKRMKDDAKEVASGYECGISIDKYNDIKLGDVIEAFVMEKE